VVGAAIVRDGCVLAARRRVPPDRWEFPGGKVEPGESAADALARECAEELAVRIAPLAPLASVTDGRIRLEIWQSRLLDGEPSAGGDHDAVRWLAARELDQVAWLPLDVGALPAVRRLLRGQPDGNSHDARMRFSTTVESGGATATGIVVPEDVVEALAAGARPPVAVTINGYTYRTTVARRGGRFLVPLSAENRRGAGVSAGDPVEVTIEVDQAPRTVEIPADLAAALAAAPDAQKAFDSLAFTHRKEWVRWVEEAKKPETRANRLAKTVAELREGRGRRA
jgi:8-oxo-dGTP pyrophosphatase MutT (NUDIX family)